MMKNGINKINFLLLKTEQAFMSKDWVKTFN